MLPTLAKFIPFPNIESSQNQIILLLLVVCYNLQVLFLVDTYMMTLTVSFLNSETISAGQMSTLKNRKGSSSDINKQISGVHSSYVETRSHEAYGASTMSDLSYLSSEAFTRMSISSNVSVDQERNHQNLGDNLDISSFKDRSSLGSSITELVIFTEHFYQLRSSAFRILQLYLSSLDDAWSS